MTSTATMGAGSMALVGATAPGPGEAGTLDGSGVSRSARDAPAVSEATGDVGADTEGAAVGVGVRAGSGMAWVAVGVGVEAGLTVGRAVGRDVGLGVDRTVGFGVAAALTTIVPNIPE